MKEETVRYQLIVPAALLEQFKEQARRERRSVSSMIVVLAEEALKSQKSGKKDDGRGNTAPVATSY